MKEEKISATENTSWETVSDESDLRPLKAIGLFVVFGLLIEPATLVTHHLFSSLAKANNKLTLKEPLRATHAEGHIVDMKCLYSEANKILTLTK